MKSMGAFLFIIGWVFHAFLHVGPKAWGKLAEQIPPDIGIFVAIVGAVMFFIGLLVCGRSGRSGSRVLVKVDNTTPESRPSGFGRLVRLLIVLGILIGGSYWAETKFDISAKVKTWVETEWPKIRKEIEKGSSNSGSSTGNPTKVEPQIPPTEPKQVEPGIDPANGAQTPGQNGRDDRKILIID